jgi:hypothetical protein
LTESRSRSDIHHRSLHSPPTPSGIERRGRERVRDHPAIARHLDGDPVTPVTKWPTVRLNPSNQWPPPVLIAPVSCDRSRLHSRRDPGRATSDHIQPCIVRQSPQYALVRYLRISSVSIDSRVSGRGASLILDIQSWPGWGRPLPSIQLG